MGTTNLTSRNTKTIKIHSSGKILAFFKLPPLLSKFWFCPYWVGMALILPPSYRVGKLDYTKNPVHLLLRRRTGYDVTRESVLIKYQPRRPSWLRTSRWWWTQIHTYRLLWMCFCISSPLLEDVRYDGWPKYQRRYNSHEIYEHSLWRQPIPLYLHSQKHQPPEKEINGHTESPNNVNLGKKSSCCLHLYPPPSLFLSIFPILRLVLIVVKANGGGTTETC